MKSRYLRIFGKQYCLSLLLHDVVLNGLQLRYPPPSNPNNLY